MTDILSFILEPPNGMSFTKWDRLRPRTYPGTAVRGVRARTHKSVDLAYVLGLPHEVWNNKEGPIDVTPVLYIHPTAGPQKIFVRDAERIETISLAASGFALYSHGFLYDKKHQHFYHSPTGPQKVISHFKRRLRQLYRRATIG